jgi:hypothetical protein
MTFSDIELLLIDGTGKKKIVLNKYSNIVDARKEMEDLQRILLPVS